MNIQEVFSKVISKEIIGKFVLRNGLQVASNNLLNWEFGFPKYQHKICFININTNQTSYIWSYYPDGKMNISEETEFDIVDFIKKRIILIMHFWGDEWFKKNGDDLCDAIDFIETYLRKHHIGIYGKEKYGCYRDEYLRFWDGGLYTILFGHRCYIGTHNNYKWKWLKEFVNNIHHFIYYKLDLGLVTSHQKGESYEDHCKRIKKRFWKGFQHYSQKIGLLKLVQDYQAKHYNKAFQLACKKWPNVKDELIVMVDGYKMIKPCKWGEVDGEEIHNKYWKKL